MSKKFRCILNIHKYKTIGTQSVAGIVCGFSMAPLMRCVRRCEYCGKIYYIGFDTSTDLHNDTTLDWQPKIN